MGENERKKKKVNFLLAHSVCVFAQLFSGFRLVVAFEGGKGKKIVGMLGGFKT